jgi:hypothetical protein
MIPAADAPAWRMDAFRDRFLAAFSERVEASTLAGSDLYPRQ